MADDGINLRSAAKQSFDSVFAIAYPQLKDMIASINQEMNNTLQDSRREIRKINLTLESYADKLLTAKEEVSYLVNMQDTVNSYLNDMIGIVGVAAAASGPGLPNIPLAEAPKEKSVEEKAKESKAKESKAKEKTEAEKNAEAEAKNTKSKDAGKAIESAASRAEGSWATRVAASLASKAAWLAVIYEAIKLVKNIYDLDSKDPNYKTNVFRLLSNFTLEFGTGYAVAAVVATVLAGVLSEPAIILASLAAGAAAVWYGEDDLHKLTEWIIEKFSSDDKKKASGSPSTPDLSGGGGSDNISGSALSALSSSDNIIFKADRIIFKSLRGGFMGMAVPQLAGAAQSMGNFEFPMVPQSRSSGGGAGGTGSFRIDRQTTAQYGISLPGVNAPGAAPNRGSRQGMMQASYGSDDRMTGDVMPRQGVSTSSGDETTERILRTIKTKESGGKYNITNFAWPKSTASGAYQFTGSTWRGLTKKYGVGTEYQEARLAPGDVQDEVARRYVKEILANNRGDVSKVPLVWYTGNPQGIMSQDALNTNKGMVAASYQSSWMKVYNSMGGSSNTSVASNKPEPKSTNTGAVINKESTEAKVSKENSQRSSSVMVNNLAVDNSKPQVSEQPQEQKKESVSIAERLGYSLATI